MRQGDNGDQRRCTEMYGFCMGYIGMYPTLWVYAGHTRGCSPGIWRFMMSPLRI